MKNPVFFKPNHNIVFRMALAAIKGFKNKFANFKSSIVFKSELSSFFAIALQDTICLSDGLCFYALLLKVF